MLTGREQGATSSATVRLPECVPDGDLGWGTSCWKDPLSASSPVVLVYLLLTERARFFFLFFFF